MKVILYYNKSEEMRVDKELDELLVINGTLRDECSIETPVILIETTPEIMSTCNYMYIEEFNRYYFVKKDIVRNNLWRITGDVDVLSSFKNEIKNSFALIVRNENNINYFLTDAEREMYAKPHTVIKKFSGNFNNQFDSVILITS